VGLLHDDTVSHAVWKEGSVKDGNGALIRKGVGREMGNPTVTDVKERSLDDMKKAATYAEWGSDVATEGGKRTPWRIYDGKTMPLLKAFLRTKHLANREQVYDGTAPTIAGGDGLAAREVLKYPQVKHVTLVDLDPDMTATFKTSAALSALNQGSLSHPKMHIVNDDAAKWLEGSSEKFDVIIIDLPDPSNFSLGKLYSVPMYRLVARHLQPQGKIVVQSTSPYFAPNAYWSVVATLEAAGLSTAPYHVYVPSFGEWGFVLAGFDKQFPVPQKFDVPTRYLNAQTAAEMFRFPPDMARRKVEPNYLNNQILVSYFESDWRNVIR